jgi:hypothetical protein
MRAKDFIPKEKPRNFVAKNAKMGGAGQHKDKKKAEKQGDVKHKKEQVPMESALSELSTDKLAQYKKAAGADAKKADADGNYARGDKRFKGINKATNKQFDNDLKKHGQQGVKEAGSPAQQAAIAINMKKHHKKPKHEDVEEGWDDIKKFGKKAAVAGAIGLGALGSAHAQDAPSGEDMLPSIVAHVTFKVDGTTITKDINLGTTFKSPGQAGDALAKFLKSKGIKYYDYSLERVKPNEPLVTPDEMKASNQEYDRRQNADNLDATPLKDKGDSKAGRMDPDSGYTSPPSRYSKAKDYMTKD